MPSYTVTVATGSQWFAGTDDYVYLTLEGTAGCSERHLLDKPFYNDFERGAVSLAGRGMGTRSPRPPRVPSLPLPPPPRRCPRGFAAYEPSRISLRGCRGPDQVDRGRWSLQRYLARRPEGLRQGWAFLRSRPRVPALRSGTPGPRCLLPFPAAHRWHPCPGG